MSGIFGIVRFDGLAVSDSDLKRQMDALAGLGPDRARRWRGDGVGLGSLLMRETCEDTFDAQPLRDADRDLAFVCNARLDNREDVAEALSIGPEALSRMADSAVLFEAYRAWGERCAEHLIGDFAFAAWDGASRRLTLGRDHMGQRHLFFHAGDGFLAFATDRKGLWTLPDVPRSLPTYALEQVLIQGRVRYRRQDFDPRPSGDLGAVPGGTVVTVSPDSEIIARQYWAPHAAPEHLGRDEDYYVEAYRRVLGEAVACRVRRANAPVGLMLGGGYDSGAIAALAATALAPGDKLIAVAGVSALNPGRGQDARRWVDICARHMPHLDLRYVTREPPDGLGALERNFFASDAPHSEHRLIGDAIFLAAKAAGARTLMTGDGGDYTLNPRGKSYFLRRLRNGPWRGLIGEWRARRRQLGWSHWDMVYSEFLSHQFAQVVGPWRRWRNGLPPFGSPMPVAADFLEQARAKGVNPWKPQRVKDRRPMMNMLSTQQKGPTVGWAATATAHGMGFTQPFHDKRVVELGLAIPEVYFIRGGRERHLARRALGDLYPPEFETRRDGNDAMQPDFMDMAERFTPTILADIDRMERDGKLAAYFDFAKMRKMLTRTLPGRPGVRSEQATRIAIRMYFRGRYIEWFTGGNG